jgi:hypothetical protein
LWFVINELDAHGHTVGLKGSLARLRTFRSRFGPEFQFIVASSESLA